MSDAYFEPLKEALSYLPEAQVVEIYEAYQFAKNAHAGQVRRSNQPFITHPVAVAEILAKLKMDQKSLIAALLHDVIEDTSVATIELKRVFGREIADMVSGLTKLERLSKAPAPIKQAENFRNMLLAMSKDIRVLIVKLADRLHNMRTLHHLRASKQRAIGRETVSIYAPLAIRLGMHDIAMELEDRGFLAMYPLRYHVLANAIERMEGSRKKVLDSIRTGLMERLQAQGVNITTLSARKKHVYSIYKKMQAKKIPFAKVSDVFALRICVQETLDCYRALGIIHGLYKPIPGKFKDYIALPKANGYQSLHTVLFGPNSMTIEIQVRTAEMDDAARSGIAAHWQYKQGSRHVPSQQWLVNMIETHRQQNGSLAFMENIKLNLFPNEIFVHTPKGDVIELPHGSTVLDFAYAIHSRMGQHCTGAKVDHQLSTIAAVLESGQKVEVLTSPRAFPSRLQLHSVVTGKAKSCIKAYLRDKKRSELVTLGGRMLTVAMQAYPGVSYEYLLQVHPGVLSEVFGVSRNELLLEAIGRGERVAEMVAMQLVQHCTPSKEPLVAANAGDKVLKINGAEGVAIAYSACCYPVPGDRIVGLFSEKLGLEVHRVECRKMQKSRKDGQIILEWADSVSGEYQTRLFVRVMNQRGALATLALVVADSLADIVDISVQPQGDVSAVVQIILNVRNILHLHTVIRKMRREKVVLSLGRSTEDVAR